MARYQDKKPPKTLSSYMFVYTDGSSIDNYIGAVVVLPLTRLTKMAIYEKEWNLDSIYYTTIGKGSSWPFRF